MLPQKVEVIHFIWLAVASCGEPVVQDGLLLCEQPEIRIWDVSAARTDQTLNPEAEVYALAFSPDGSLLAYAGADGNVYIWDMISDALIDTAEGHTAPVNILAFSEDGTVLVSGSDDETVRIWTVEIESAG